MFARLAIFPIMVLCGGGGAGIVGAVTTQDWKLLLAAAVALTGASIWIATVVWRVAAEHQHVLDKICTTADRMQRLSADWEDQVAEINESVVTVKHDVVERIEAITTAISKRCERHEAAIADLATKQAEADGRCQGRAETYRRIGAHLQESGGTAQGS